MLIIRFTLTLYLTMMMMMINKRSVDLSIDLKLAGSNVARGNRARNRPSKKIV